MTSLSSKNQQEEDKIKGEGRVLNVGSVNIDHVYSVTRIVKEGETREGKGYQRGAGGKGANQSVALSKAGAHCFHSGKIGTDGIWVKELMEEVGVDCRLVLVDDLLSTGTAIIQVCETTKQNSILIWPGGNAGLTTSEVKSAFSNPVDISPWGPQDWLVVQNELPLTPIIIAEGHKQGMWVAYNPAPLSQELIQTIPWDKLDLICLNESETIELFHGLFPTKTTTLQEKMELSDWQRLATTLLTHPLLQTHLQWLLITLGDQGALALSPVSHQDPLHVIAFVPPSPIQDTTGAGDTFFGYLVASLAARGLPHGTPLPPPALQHAMQWASAAASVAITRPGAIPSIPTPQEILTAFPHLPSSPPSPQ